LVLTIEQQFMSLCSHQCAWGVNQLPRNERTNISSVIYMAFYKYGLMG